MIRHRRRPWTLGLFAAAAPLRAAGAALRRLACLALLATVAGAANAAPAAQTAPEIDLPGLQWYNVAAPLSLVGLRGRLVILDFWTEGCINCIHIIASLRRIERHYPDQVVVIGVHSPKFANEKSAVSVQDAIRRYDIRHPIVHDPELKLWNAYGVTAWPTLIVLGPDGAPLGALPGEPDPDWFDQAIGKLVQRYATDGTLKPAALELKLLPEPKGRFLYPGKLKPVPGAEPRWALADGGHHQIVLLDDHGAELRRYGSGDEGFQDGPAGVASFNHPQGLVAAADAIYVADTGNHAIRRIDLASGAVTTLAGTGRRGGLLGAAQPGRETALASPWDLERSGEQLYFANAGSHQLGRLDLSSGKIERLAGSGEEALDNGSAAASAFAQPSGLSLGADAKTLYVADAESSAVRAVTLAPKLKVETLVGAGLFDFGRIDGSFRKARLQHDLGVAADGGRILVADTYNSTIRQLDLDKREVSEFDGGAYTCTDKICIPTREPAGIVAAGPDRVLLVDTGNHRIEEYQPSSRTYHTWAR